MDAADGTEMSGGGVPGDHCCRHTASARSRPVERWIEDVAAAAIEHAKAIRSRRDRIDQQTERRRIEEQEAKAQHQQKEIQRDLDRPATCLEHRAAIFKETERIARLVRVLQHTIESNLSIEDA